MKSQVPSETEIELCGERHYAFIYVECKIKYRH